VLGWSPTLPSITTILWLAPILAAGVLALFCVAGRLKTRRGVRTGFTRKIVHFVLFGSATALSLTLGYEGVNLLGGIGALVVLFALWRGNGHPFYEAIARESDAPRRTFYVIAPFAATVAGGISSALLFGEFAAVGYLVAGCGDAIAEPVGLRFGRHPYRAPGLGFGVRSVRTLEGSAAVLVTSFAVATLVLGLAPFASDWTIGAALLTALVVAVAAALVEAASPHGLDNLTVQLAASGVAFGMA
jgi:phytol kinase